MTRPGAFVLAVLATGGCTRVVDLDVARGPIRLVVEGRIERRADPSDDLQLIRLTTTDRFDAVTPPPSASGARVTVTEVGGTPVAFTPHRLGGVDYYAGRLAARLGARYVLEIEYQGERYRAEHDLVEVSPVDSLYFVFEDKGLAQGDSGFRAVIDYRDPAGAKNYYLWELVVDGQRRLSPDPGNRFRVISDDRFYDGGEVIGYQPFDEEVVETGQSVVVRQLGLSEAGFRYHFALFEQTTGSGSPFSTPPASVRGNVVNLTNPANYPLGFFFASQVAARSAVVPAR